MRLSKEDIRYIKSGLKQFIGTQEYHRLSLGRMVCTDGIKYLAEKCGAFWLIDLVASYQIQEFREAHRFQLWKVTLLEGNKAVVTCKEDTGAANLVEQHIEFTDFPFDYEWYVVDGVMMVKSEY